MSWWKKPAPDEATWESVQWQYYLGNMAALVSALEGGGPVLLPYTVDSRMEARPEEVEMNLQALLIGLRLHAEDQGIRVVEPERKVAQ